MNKRLFSAIMGVFLLWEALDFIMHNVLLGSQYMATAELWRDQVQVGLLFVVVLIAAASFVYIYSAFVRPKSTRAGVTYGLIYGIGTGISFAYGTYATMEIPYTMAMVWFLGTLVQTTAAGWFLGAYLKDEYPADEPVSPPEQDD